MILKFKKDNMKIKLSKSQWEKIGQTAGWIKKAQEGKIETNKCYVTTDQSYAPGCFIIVKEGGDIYNEEDTVLVQTDWDYPGVAANLGYVPCACRETDGTIPCKHKTVGQMIEEAAGWLTNHEGELFEDPGYF